VFVKDLLEYGCVGFSHEERIAASGTRVLDITAIAASDLAVAEAQKDGDALPRLPYAAEARCERSTFIEEAVIGCAGFDCSLIVGEESRDAGDTQYVGHMRQGRPPLLTGPRPRGFPTRRPLLTA